MSKHKNTPSSLLKSTPVVEESKRPFISVKNTYYLVALVAFVMYANTLTLEYALDDRLMITDNQYTKKGVDGIKEIMSNDAFTGFFGSKKSLVAGGRYRPLTHVMFAIEYQIFGFNPFIGHLINLLLFMGLSVLLYHILRKLLAPYDRAGWLGSLALITTLLFVVHPIHTEVVANIKGRDELMSLLFSLLTLWFAIKYVEKKGVVNLLWMIIAFVVAVFSKENSLTFVLVIPMVLYFFYKPSLRQYLILFSGLIAATAFFMAVRIQVVGGMLNTTIAPEILNNPFLNIPKSTAIVTVIFTWGKYLLLMIFPHPLTHDYYPYQIAYYQFSNPLIIFLTLFFVSISLVALWGAVKKKLWSFAILFALVTFSVQSNLVFNIGTFMNERFVFVPSIGLLMLMAFGLWNIAQHQKYLKLVPIMFLILISCYGAKTITRNFVWKNDKTLFLTDVKVSTNSIKCNVSAGGTCVEMAKAEPDSSKKTQLVNQGFGYLQMAQKLHPGSFYAWFLMGNGYLEISNFEQSILYFDRAIQINPQSKEALNNLQYVAQISVKNGNYQASVKAYQILCRQEPKNIDYLVLYADGLSRTNQSDSALMILDRVILENPKNASAWSKKGEIFGRVKNDLNSAEFFLKQSISINPNDLSANENLGIVYGIRKQYQQSIYYFNQALKVDSTQARIYQNIAGTYAAMGDKASAQRYIQKAAQIIK
ncbi:MAG: glycosyltransferase family 39 protein [Bacteroidota bacterium]